MTAKIKMSQFEPGGIVLILTCKLCGSQGTTVIDPIKQVVWKRNTVEEVES